MNSHLNINAITKIDSNIVSKQVQNALAEDIGSGDLSAALIPSKEQAIAAIKTREPMVLCGSDYLYETIYQIDPNIQIKAYYKDGDSIEADQILFQLQGSAKNLLTAERTMLNFIQFYSAISTKTKQYVNTLSNHQTKILDTRKTIPGHRLAEKYAVYCGGGQNHRIGLFDAFLIKENHIIACHGIKNAVNKAKEIAPNKLIEVEVENMEELKESIDAGVDVIMLDDFSLSDMSRAVLLVNHKVALEASGNMSLEQVVKVANTGVDFISIGDLTKNIQSIDLSMRFSLSPC